ncbi:hypothetical protein J3R30DRAFT_3291559 [Lentinula aciculospora]|uniref:Cytoplasmic tRNA 2-thiolation protein 2 n=1 Tax=Lentinula aciculospora TaxID=153920 RepID=A0A9W9A9X3_9AGAR|nr:hypothetical protein J3R30DRAFT_3291559 [Lentinula aciculospora]
MVSESCSNPSVETEAIMSRRPKYDKSKFCIKCKVNTGAIVVRHAVYCKECFPTLLSSKVKRILEPRVNSKPELSRRKSLKASGNLLIGFSGGLGSTVLLDLISKLFISNRIEIKEDGVTKPRGGKDHPRNEPVWKRVSVCYVEIAAGFLGATQIDKIQRLVQEKYEGVEFVAVKLENAFDPSWWDELGGKAALNAKADLADDDLLVSTIFNRPDSDPVQRLRLYISALPTHTAIESAIRTLIRILLLYTARLTRSSHLLLGTSLTSLSINLISSIAQGGGFSVREEAQEEWRSDSKEAIRLIRPLQEITIKECAMWAWWNELPVVGRQRYPGVKQGIGALTKDFIVGLERDYPSTVSTIARTCAKLAPKVEAAGLCILCERPLQPDVQEWKARISIRATIGTSLLTPPSNTLDSSSLLKSLTPHLCYSCHTTLVSRNSKGVSGNPANTWLPLPVWASAHIQNPSPDADDISMQLDANEAGDEIWLTHKVGPDETMAVIKEFLLE